MLLLVITAIVGLSANNIVVEYTPANSFYFKRGEGILSDKLVGYIGTIVFTNNNSNTTTNPIYNPTMIRVDMTYSFFFDGPTTWRQGENSSSQFYLTSAYVDAASGTIISTQPLNQAHNPGDPTPLRSSSTPYTGKTLRIDLYLVSHHDFSLYEPYEGSTYQLTEDNLLTKGNLGSFRVGVTTSSEWYSDKTALPLPVGDNTDPETPIPFFNDQNINPEHTDPVFGEPEPIVTYLFAFRDKTVPISLQDGDGVGSNARFEVNEARMTLANTKANNTYSVQIKIKDDSPSPTSFQLLPEQSGPNPINYNLYWGTTTSNAQIVVKNGEIDWGNLKESTNPNARKLYIGNISANDVAKAASGTYKSTITIEIISKN